MQENENRLFLVQDESIEIPSYLTGRENPFKMLKHEVDEIQSKCSDFIGRRMTVGIDKNSDELCLYYEEEKTNHLHCVSFSAHSFSQLCAKIGVPVRYMIKCMEEGEGNLVVDNLNTWLDKQEKSLFIREYDGRARGILSDRYSVLDTPDVMEVLMNTLDNDFLLKGSMVNEERFHARFIDHNPLGVDDMFVGVQVDTSDVGRSKLEISFFIYKQVCTNGLVVKKFGGEIFSQKHIGITPDVFRRELVANLERLPELTRQAKTHILMAKDNKLSPSDLLLGDDMSKLMRDFKQSTGASDKVLELVANRTHHYGLNRWGFINAITEVSQQYQLDRRLQFENYAGLLLVA